MLGEIGGIEGIFLGFGLIFIGNYSRNVFLSTLSNETNEDPNNLDIKWYEI
jgi:hypothetical protein